jgi:hypothetical protein
VARFWYWRCWILILYGIDLQLLENHIKNEIIEKSQLVHALPDGEENKITFSEPRKSASVACGATVFEVCMKVPTWASQVFQLPLFPPPKRNQKKKRTFFGSFVRDVIVMSLPTLCFTSSFLVSIMSFLSRVVLFLEHAPSIPNFLLDSCGHNFFNSKLSLVCKLA